MIISTIINSQRIEPLHPLFKRLFDYVKSHDLENAELGRIVLDGDNLFINNINPTLITPEEQIMEAHHEYIDIHFPLDKTEIYSWKPTENCENVKSDYNEKDDCALFNDTPSNYVTVTPGEFLIVFPEDAHGPIIGEGKIRKLIAKIKVQI